MAQYKLRRDFCNVNCYDSRFLDCLGVEWNGNDAIYSRIVCVFVLKACGRSTHTFYLSHVIFSSFFSHFLPLYISFLVFVFLHHIFFYSKVAVVGSVCSTVFSVRLSGIPAYCLYFYADTF